jgi:predicted TPR repeat methyltransferase
MKLRTVDEIQYMMFAHFPSAVLVAAFEKALFWQFDGRPQTVETMAGLLGIAPGICRNWLRLLASLGLLEESEEGYQLTAVAQTAIIDSYDAGTWSELARDERRRWTGDLALLGELIEPGSSDRPAIGVLGPDFDYVLEMMVDPQQAHRFTHMLYDLHGPLAEDVARHLDLTGATRLLDIGGGSGVVSLALLRKDPGLSATVMDIPNVCVVGREIADGTPEAVRISYYGANFVEDEFPGCFDLILACDIMGYEQALIDKVAAHLEIGGRFVIVDRWFEELREWSIGQSTYLLRRSLKDPGLALPAYAQVYDRLRKAGLEPIAREEIRYGRWQMIQARKTA